jgi:hypothetical protein
MVKREIWMAHLLSSGNVRVQPPDGWRYIETAPVDLQLNFWLEVYMGFSAFYKLRWRSIFY